MTKLSEEITRASMSETDVEKRDAEVGVKRTKFRRSIEDIKMEAALRAELGEDVLTSEEYSSVFA